MSFRFRRSIKLLPGIRMNLSGSGASISVGGNGATMSFSSRGARATFGIPGSGLSHSTTLFRPQTRKRRAGEQTTRITSAQQLVDATYDPRATVVYAKSQRRLSASQLAAAHRELARREQHAQAQSEVARMESEERAVLESWREAAEMVSAREQAEALRARPFASTEPAPHAPDYATAELLLREKALEDVQLSMPRPTASRLLGLGIAVLIGAAIVLFAGTSLLPVLAALAAAFICGVGVDRISRARWEREIAASAQGRADAEWPQERARQEQQHVATLAEFAERDAVARTHWESAEDERVAWAQALAQGDLATIEETIFDSLDEIDFPFEANCVVAAEDAENVFVSLDLPEIEDVIPETRFNVLKNGSLREVKRKTEERNGAYARLVCGIVLGVAATVFSAAPTVRAVTIAAFTQRKRRGAVDVEDAFVVESRVAREGLEALNVRAADPVETLGRMQTRWEWGANLVLKKLPAPPWVLELGRSDP